MIDEIKKEAEALVEKQSWVRKGFSEMLEKMDSEVQPIIGDFTIHGTLYEEPQDWDQRDITVCYVLTLKGEDDAKFYLQKRIVRYESRYEDVNIDICEIASLRNCVAGIPTAIEEILGKLKELNTKYQEAIDALSEMIAKLK